MGIAYVKGKRRALAAGALLSLTLSLGGCATSTAGSSQMDARAEALAPLKKSAYPRLEDQPQSRESVSADELKLKKELTAARDRQAAAIGEFFQVHVLLDGVDLFLSSGHQPRFL